MKTKYSFFLLIFSLIFHSVLFAQGTGFNSIFSKDGNDVIAVGAGGNFFRSADGGNSWAVYQLGTNNLTGVFAVSQDICVTGYSGVVIMSSNNGTTWNTTTLNNSPNVNGVYFINANTGWVVTNSVSGNGTIYKTVNGGANWTMQTSPVSNNLNSVKFIDANTGVACGTNGSVITTTNGGSTWSSSTTPVTKELLSVDASGNTIIATARDGLIIKSVNFGSSWTIVDYKILTKSDVYSVYMMDGNNFYTCGGGGFIRKTTDGGSTFSYQINPMMANLVKIYFYSSTKGWAVSSLNNAILWTNDGGNTWNLPAGTTVTFSWVQKQAGSANIGNGFSLYPPEKNVLYCCMGNQVFKSTNTGDNWTQISTLPTSYCHDFYVHPYDSTRMITSCGSSGGHVYRSTNYGASWTDIFGAINLSSYGMPMRIDMNHPDTVFLGPDYDYLRRTTDFGITWTNISTNTFRSPCDFAVLFGNSNIMYCGDGVTGSGNGEFFRSTDNGHNWTSIHTVSGSEIPMIGISSLNPNVAYHSTWSSGGIWKTTDQWSTYNEVQYTGNCWALDIAKDDPNVMAYGTYGSTVYISTDGGNTTTQTNVPSSPEAGELFYDRGNLFVQHGSGVYKLVVSYSVVTAVPSKSSEIPKTYSLSQNYPNPFNPVTKINYNISHQSYVQIKVYDILGNLVKDYVNSSLSPGKYSLSLDASAFSSGIYFYSLYADNMRIDTRKMILVK